MQVGNLIDDTDRSFKNPQQGRVYSTRGIAPTITCMQGGNLEPKILEHEHTISKNGTESYENAI